MTTDVKAAVDAAFRDEWGRVVATLIRTTGDWDLAEECAQDAFALALQRWPRDGIPARPGAWLTTAARNRAIDVLRRKAVGAAKLREVAAMSYEPEPLVADDSDESGVPDEPPPPEPPGLKIPVRPPSGLLPAAPPAVSSPPVAVTVSPSFVTTLPKFCATGLPLASVICLPAPSSPLPIVDSRPFSG